MTIALGEKILVTRSDLEEDDGWCYATKVGAPPESGGFVPSAYLAVGEGDPDDS